jgi:1,4-alpha-glucan branching enzyme
MSRHHGSKPQTRHHTVTLHAPGAKTVAVTGSFCNWSSEGQPLKHDGHGTWKATLALPPGRYEYRLLVDGRWQDDAECRQRVPNPFGTENCVFEL